MRDIFNNRLLGWVHRRECKMLGCTVPVIGKTVRRVFALAIPFFDGDAPGRSYTPYERKHLADPRFYRRRRLS